MAVLVDGDSLIVSGDFRRRALADIQFHDKHLKAGPQGGQAAAQALCSAVLEADGLHGDEPAPVVAVYVFLNKSGIGNSLIKVSLPCRSRRMSHFESRMG